MVTRLLLVDDCPQITKMLRIITERYFSQTVELTTALSLKQAHDALAHGSPDVILLDYRLRPYDDCSETIPSLRAAGYDGPIHIWSTLDKALLRAAHGCSDISSMICKLDFQGLRLRNLLNDLLVTAREGQYAMAAASAAPLASNVAGPCMTCDQVPSC